MSRLDTMARFEEPSDPVLRAYCRECNDELYTGDTIVRTEDDDIFCGTFCYLEHHQIKTEEL